jgi:DNA gyrase subunit B
MIARGLDGTELFIRNTNGTEEKSGKTKEKSKASKKAGQSGPQQITGQKLSDLIKMLSEAERLVSVLSRRGINFDSFIEKYYTPSKGGLPQFRITIDSEEEVFYNKDKYEQRVDELKEKAEKASDKEKEQEEERFDAEELHEVLRINQINEQLNSQYGLDLKDYLLKEEKTVSGEAIETKFQLKNDEESYEIASLGEICPGIRQIGGKGMEIKRFKGLGEMNADQLWETTMNPATRTLLSVKLEDAGEADRLFSILMGDNVEERRSFIQDHALEVQNLDI